MLKVLYLMLAVENFQVLVFIRKIKPSPPRSFLKYLN